MHTECYVALAASEVSLECRCFTSSLATCLFGWQMPGILHAMLTPCCAHVAAWTSVQVFEPLIKSLADNALVLTGQHSFD